MEEPSQCLTTTMIVKQNIFLCCRKKLAFRKNHNHRAFHHPNMHVVIALFCSCSTVLLCQHIPCDDPFSGCNVLCCRLFRRGVRFVRSLPCSSTMLLESMDSLYLPSLPLLSYYMALSHIYCNKFSFETFDEISV